MRDNKGHLRLLGVVVAGALMLAASRVSFADDGRLVMASGAVGERQMLALDPQRPGVSVKLGKAEAYLPEGSGQGLVSNANKIEKAVWGESERKAFAESAKLVNAGQAVKTKDGRLFVISQGNRRIIEFAGETGKFVAEHFLEGPTGEAMAPRGLAVIDKGVVALGTESDARDPVRVFVLETGGNNTKWTEQEVAWPDGKMATQAGQACGVSEKVVAFVDTSTLRVIELDFSQKQVKGKLVSTLAYGQAAGASGLALDSARGVYFVGSVGKDTVLAIKRATGEADPRISAISVTDPTFLCWVPGGAGAEKPEAAKSGKDGKAAPKAPVQR